MRNYTAIKPTQTFDDFFKGLTKSTRQITVSDRDGWPMRITEEIYLDEVGNVWIVKTDRDGWLYKYIDD